MWRGRFIDMRYSWPSDIFRQWKRNWLQFRHGVQEAWKRLIIYY